MDKEMVSKRHRKAQSMSTAVNDVTDQTHAVSGHQLAGCTSVSCASHVHHALAAHHEMCMRVAAGSGVVTSAAALLILRSILCCCCCCCDSVL